MLHVDDLAVSRGGVGVLAGVCFAVQPGQALILRGPNGVGKTSLLRVLAGLQPAQAGQVVRDEDQLIYASHADGIKAMLTVQENLSFWAAVFGTRGIDPALEGFDLTALRDRLAGTLSAGQKRRLGLARLLVSGRRLWLLDEPTVSLDSASVAIFARVIETHLAAGGAAVLATHIDLGVKAQTLDLTPFKARQEMADAPDEAFL